MASPLVVGRRAATLARLDWVAFAALYALAAFVRGMVLSTEPYTAEAAHFVVAERLWTNTPGPANVYNGERIDYSYLFWQRPMFSLVLAPAAQVSFTAYRAMHIAIAALLPCLAAALARSLGVRRPFAWAAGAALALHPLLVAWGALVLPDSLMAVCTLSGLLAWQHGRVRTACAFLLAACWTKEVAVLTPAVLFLLEARAAQASGNVGWWPLRLTRELTALGAVLALAFVPLLVSMSRPFATFPGWGVGGDPLILLERLTLTVWLLPMVLLAALAKRTRPLGILAAAWTAFFLLYRGVLGRAVEAWYIVLPATLAVLAAALVLDHVWTRPARGRRAAVLLGALLLAGLVLVQVGLDNGIEARTAVLAPFSGQAHWSLPQTLQYEEGRGSDLAEAMRSIPKGSDLLAIDVDWAFMLHPLQTHGGTVYGQSSAITTQWGLDVHAVSDAIENRTSFTLLRVSRDLLNVAVRDVYADCQVASVGEYVLIEGPSCPGRGPRLHEAARRT